MPELPQRKVGIVACSGEELPEGTITRLAALRVLEQMRPGETVTICLPLFLAGGEGDRAFAKFYPTIAIDGCEKRCAYRETELYSNKPAAGIVVTDLIKEHHLEQPLGSSKLNPSGLQAVEVVANEVAAKVDELLGKTWSRREGTFTEPQQSDQNQEEVVATCSCGSGIPIQVLQVNGQEMTIVALPLIFQNFFEKGKLPQAESSRELMETVKIYNEISPEIEQAVADVLIKEYASYCQKQEKKA